jgi:hypothetical protein
VCCAFIKVPLSNQPFWFSFVKILNSMKKTSSITAIIIVVLAACKSGPNYGDIAADMCNCFNKVKDSIPAAALPVFEKTATAADVKKAYQEELAKLPSDVLMKVTNALLSTNKPGSAFTDCLEQVDKKHKVVGKSQKEATQKIVDAVKGKSGCELMTALLRMQVESDKK